MRYGACLTGTSGYLRRFALYFDARFASTSPFT